MASKSRSSKRRRGTQSTNDAELRSFAGHLAVNLAYRKWPQDRSFYDQAEGMSVVLEFSSDDAARYLRAGSVLPGQMHLLQLSHWRVLEQLVFSLCRSGLP